MNRGERILSEGNCFRTGAYHRGPGIKATSRLMWMHLTITLLPNKTLDVGLHVDWRDTSLAGMKKHTIGGNWFLLLLAAPSIKWGYIEFAMARR